MRTQKALNSRLQYLEFEVTVAVNMLGVVSLEGFSCSCAAVQIRCNLAHRQAVVI